MIINSLLFVYDTSHTPAHLMNWSYLNGTVYRLMLDICVHTYVCGYRWCVKLIPGGMRTINFCKCNKLMRLQERGKLIKVSFVIWTTNISVILNKERSQYNSESTFLLNEEWTEEITSIPTNSRKLNNIVYVFVFQDKNFTLLTEVAKIFNLSQYYLVPDVSAWPWHLGNLGGRARRERHRPSPTPALRMNSI